MPKKQLLLVPPEIPIRSKKHHHRPDADAQQLWLTAHFAQACQWHQQGQLEAAEKNYRQILQRFSTHADSLMLLAHLCVNGTGHADTADIVTRALQSNPLHPVAHCHLGLWRLQQQQPAPAIDCYRQALQIEPAHAQAHFNLALCLLLTGDFEAGWPAFEWRWQTVQYRRAQRQFTQPLWLGQTPLAGKTILLHAEQGLGDTLQFCRYASVLARRGARVLLQVQPVLQPLLRSLDGVAQVLATSAALPSFDYHCPLMSLPLALRTRLGDVPASPGYLSATVPDDLARWQRQLGPKAQARIGLVWADNPGHGNDARR